MEIQILDDDAAGHRNIKPAQRTGSIYLQMAARQGLAKKPGQWNRYLITCRGPLVVIELNGVPLALPSGPLVGEISLPVQWQTLFPAGNVLTVSPVVMPPSGPFVSDFMQLSSGRIAGATCAATHSTIPAAIAVARLLGAPAGELAACVAAVTHALAHPILASAREAQGFGGLRRETPVLLALPVGAG